MGLVIFGREHLPFVEIREQPVCLGQGIANTPGKDFSCLLVREFQSAGRSGACFYIFFPFSPLFCSEVKLMAIATEYLRDIINSAVQQVQKTTTSDEEFDILIAEAQ